METKALPSNREAREATTASSTNFPREAGNPLFLVVGGAEVDKL